MTNTETRPLSIETSQMVNLYIEGEYINGGKYFEGPFDFHNIFSALEAISSDETRVTKIILEKD